jgi:hypothetical protein
MGLIRGCAVLVCAALAGACGGDWPGADSPAPEGETPAVEAPAVQAPAAEAPVDAPAAGQASSDVVGRWQGAADQVEFFPGGRVLLRRGEFRGAGRYEFVQPARILITWEGALLPSAPGDYAVTRADSLLSLCETDRPARCIHYTPRRPDQAPPPAVPMDPDAPRLAEAPRGEQVPPEARMAEARVTLKQAYTLQQVYRMERGRFAPGMDSLREVGWQDAPLRHFAQPRVVRADDRRLCVVIEPRAPDLWPLHVDEQGSLGTGPC